MFHHIVLIHNYLIENFKVIITPVRCYLLLLFSMLIGIIMCGRDANGVLIKLFILFTQGSFLVIVTCAYMLMDQGVIFQVIFYIPRL